MTGLISQWISSEMEARRGVASWVNDPGDRAEWSFSLTRAWLKNLNAGGLLQIMCVLR